MLRVQQRLHGELGGGGGGGGGLPRGTGAASAAELLYQAFQAPRAALLGLNTPAALAAEVAAANAKVCHCTGVLAVQCQVPLPTLQQSVLLPWLIAK